MASTLRTETESHVRSICLTRAKEYNTLTPELRDELAKAIDEADANADVHVILLRAEGPAFCAGYGLDCTTVAQAGERPSKHICDAIAERMAQVPTTQLVMLKLLCNQTAENMGLASSRLIGLLFDGIARHTQEGLDFVTKAREVGFRQAVRERDDPFGDYGSGPRKK